MTQVGVIRLGRSCPEWLERVMGKIIIFPKLFKNSCSWKAVSGAEICEKRFSAHFNVQNAAEDFDQSHEENSTAGAKQNPSSSTQDAAARLLDEYGNAILRMSYSYLHNMSDAEEILQETLIKYLEAKPVLHSASHEKAWLLTVASNLSKNKIKYNSIRQTDELNDELVAESRDDLSFVWEAVKSLPEKWREVIHLFYQEGYSTKQVAEILGRKESTVRSDLKRGREKLREVLREAYDFEG